MPRLKDGPARRRPSAGATGGTSARRGAAASELVMTGSAVGRVDNPSYGQRALRPSAPRRRRHGRGLRPILAWRPQPEPGAPSPQHHSPEQAYPGGPAHMARPLPANAPPARNGAHGGGPGLSAARAGDNDLAQLVRGWDE